MFQLIMFLSPSHPFVIALNSQVLGATGWLSSWPLSYCSTGVHPTGQVCLENEKRPLIKAEYSPKSSVFTCQQLNEQAKVFQGSCTRTVPHHSHFVVAQRCGCRWCVSWRERIAPRSVFREGVIFGQKFSLLSGDWFSKDWPWWRGRKGSCHRPLPFDHCSLDLHVTLSKGLLLGCKGYRLTLPLRSKKGSRREVMSIMPINENEQAISFTIY